MIQVNNVRTIVVNSDVSARIKEDIVMSKTCACDVLVGFASYGKAKYEDTYNPELVAWIYIVGTCNAEFFI